MANRVISAYRGNVPETEFRAMLSRPRAEAGRPLGSIWMRPDGTDVYPSAGGTEERNTAIYLQATGFIYPYIHSLTSIQEGSIDAQDKVVQFGSGVIGRGFLAPIFAQAGHRISFLDADMGVIDALRNSNSYSVSIGGDEITMTDIHVINSVLEKEAAVAEIIRAQIVTTSVGPKILPRIAPTIAEAVYWRMAFGLQSPLNIILLENLPIEVSDDFKTVKDQLLEFRTAFFAGREENSDFHDYVRQYVGFARAIGNYPGGMIDNDPLRMAISGHDHKIPVDGQNFIGSIDVPQVELVANFDALVCQKLLRFNMAHALVAYLGFCDRRDTIPESFSGGFVRRVFEGAMAETGTALERHFGFEVQQTRDYFDHTVGIFSTFPDDILRVGADPYRKLAPNDRLMRAAMLCLMHGIEPVNVSIGIAAGIRYALNATPEQDKTIGTRPDIVTAQDVLTKVCGLELEDHLAGLILEAFHKYFS